MGKLGKYKRKQKIKMRLDRKKAKMDRRDSRKQARFDRREARKQARYDRKAKRKADWEAKRPERIAKRKKFFKSVGKGLKSMGAGLLCATEASFSVIAKDPEVMGKLKQMGKAAAMAAATDGASALNPAMVTETMGSVAKLAGSVGSAVVNKCVKNPKHRELANSMIKATDLAKYASIAHEEGSMAALKALVEDTKEKAVEHGMKVAKDSGISPEVLLKQKELLKLAKNVGLPIPDNFLEMEISDKMKMLADM